jgi:hypothetical protein
MAASPGIRHTLRHLAERGLARQDPEGGWRLTLAGVAAGRKLVTGEDPPPAAASDRPTTEVLG